MTQHFTIRVAINGSETDSVTSTSWLTKVSGVKVSGGGGTWTSPAQPLICDFALNIRAQRANGIRTIAVAIQGPIETVPGGAHDNGDGTCYRVIFFGTVTSIRGAIGPGAPIRFTATDQMSGLFNRVPRLAAGATSPRGVLQDIDTALGTTTAGDLSFPNATTDGAIFAGYREATKKLKCGAIIQQALAGTGINMVSEWDEPITAPVLRWRPDFFYIPDGTATINTARMAQVQVHAAWLADYSDYGIAYGDFPAKVIVDGVNSSYAAIYGTARLSSSTKRAEVANREAKVAGYIGTQADCEAAADRLLGRTCNPDYLKMYRVKWVPDLLYDTVQTNWGGLFSTVSDSVFATAAIRIGDLMYANDPFSDTVVEGGAGKDLWPASMITDPTAAYTDVEDLWVITKSDSGDTVTTRYHLVRFVEYVWDGRLLTTTVGMHPRGNHISSDAGDLTRGAY